VACEQSHTALPSVRILRPLFRATLTNVREATSTDKNEEEIYTYARSHRQKNNN
jgi:hypothetical protein